MEPELPSVVVSLAAGWRGRCKDGGGGNRGANQRPQTRRAAASGSSAAAATPNSQHCAPLTDTSLRARQPAHTQPTPHRASAPKASESREPAILRRLHSRPLSTAAAAATPTLKFFFLVAPTVTRPPGQARYELPETQLSARPQSALADSISIAPVPRGGQGALTFCRAPPKYMTSLVPSHLQLQWPVVRAKGFHHLHPRIGT